MNKLSSIFIFTFVWLLWLVVHDACNQKKQDDVYIYRNHSDSAKYIGGEACKECHADKYKSFTETGMGQSFGDATQEKSVGEFHSFKPVYDASNQMYYVAKFENKQLFILEYRLDNTDTVYKRQEKIDYVIGSGNHTNSHLFQVNGYLYQAPLTFYTQAKKWDLPPGFENGNNSRFSRIIGYECMSCHNSLPEYENGSENKFTKIPKGISCERCHGPGSIHVEEKKNGIIVNTQNDIDYTIVNPKKLPWDRQVDVCQRCHLQGNAVLHEGKDWNSFRPGMKLNEYIDVYAPEYDGGNQFIMASHAQRLQQSACFIKSNQTTKNNLTCINCHNPHVSVKKTGTAIFNNACIKCHQTDICKESKKVRDKLNDNCVQCHMPKSGTGDIPHVTVHDHYIRKPNKKVEDKTAEIVFRGLRCINNPTSSNHSRATAWLNAFEQFGNHKHTLDSAGLYIDKLTKDQQLPFKVRQLFLLNKYSDIYLLKIDVSSIKDAWSAYRVGEASSVMQDYIQAEKYYNKAVSLAPKNLEFREKLASTYIINIKYTEALKELNMLISIQPKLAMAWSNKGYILKTQNKFDEAMKCFEQALALEPDYIKALENYIDLCHMQNKNKDMQKAISRLLKLQPNHPIKSLLSTLK